MVGPKNPQNPQNFPNTQPSSVSPLGSVRVGSAGGLPAEGRCRARGSGLLSENRTHEHHPSCEWPWQYMWHIIYIYDVVSWNPWWLGVPPFPDSPILWNLHMTLKWEEHIKNMSENQVAKYIKIPKSYRRHTMIYSEKGEVTWTELHVPIVCSEANHLRMEWHDGFSSQIPSGIQQPVQPVPEWPSAQGQVVTCILWAWIVMPKVSFTTECYGCLHT
jgi:hypothetical protein